MGRRGTPEAIDAAQVVKVPHSRRFRLSLAGQLEATVARCWDDDPVSRKFDLGRFKERALAAYARALDRGRTSAPRLRFLLSSSSARVHQGVVPRREDQQTPGHPDRPHVE